jgi:Tol biopolymer transport system component
MRVPALPAACIACVACTACSAPSAQGSASTLRGPARWTPAAWSSPAYESSVTFSPDGRHAVFMRADAAFGSFRLHESWCEGGHWTPPRPVPFAAPAPADDADPGFRADGRRLYFVSTRAARPGAPPRDDFDIWVVDRRPAGWGVPRRLPEPVNSAASELLPRAGPHGALYFGSDRPGGHGRSDIYVASPAGGAGPAAGTTGAWTVTNAGPPVSTAADEYEAEVSRDGRTLVVVVDRGDRSHLYRFASRSGRWVEQGRVPARPDVFQVGPLLSPRGDRLLFGQADPADAARSGELFLVDLAPAADPRWPPRCGGGADPR